MSKEKQTSTFKRNSKVKTTAHEVRRNRLCNICDNESTKIIAKESLCKTLKLKRMLVPHCGQTVEETCCKRKQSMSNYKQVQKAIKHGNEVETV